jgi:hypothetical protein
MNKILSGIKKMIFFLLKGIGALLIFGFFLIPYDKSDKSSGTYVEASIDRRGKFRKAHYRKSFSTDPSAIKKRNASRKYYHTKGKYLRRKKKSE